MQNNQPRPSWLLTLSFWVALTALHFTSGSDMFLLVGLLALGPHLTKWRMPRDSSVIWIIRLLIFGGAFVFFGGNPGIGADWIFDAKTFNMLGLIAAGEALLELWREPPPGARYHAVTVFCIGFVFLAACNTYEDRYIRYFAPVYLLLALLSLREWRADSAGWRLTLPRGRGLVALACVLALGAASHLTITKQREQLMRWGYRLMMDRKLNISGVSEQPRLSSTFNLQGSTRRVLKITGQMDTMHLRAAAFDTYINGTWNPPVSSREKEDFPETTPTAPKGSKLHTLSITRLGTSGGLIFVPLNAVTVVPSPGSGFEWNAALGPVRNEDPPPYTYETTWREDDNPYGVQTYQGILCTPLKAEEKMRWLQLPPEVDPRVKQLAKRLTAGALHPAQGIEAIAEHLMSNHKYSLSTKRGPGDPVSSFILEKKSAHCEYFASAAVVLMRAAGIPSRYVTGYLAHESDGAGNTVVRQRDAHAWAEAWVEGTGWVTVEATPASGTPEANEDVSAWQRNWEKFQDAFQSWRENATALSGAQIFGLVLLIVLVWVWERWRIRRRQLAAQEAGFAYASPEELRALTARFEKLLQKQNGEISQARPLGDYAGDEAARRFLQDYNRARFGGALDQELLRELKAQLETLEKGTAHDTDPRPSS